VDSSLFLGGSLVAAVIAGTIALFAPCCLSVMLPAYLASAFQNRRVLFAMTFVFAAGVATLILPVALGGRFIIRLVTGEHTTIYVVGGFMMIGLGAYTLLGGRIRIPMPGARETRGGVGGVYLLGLFSGVASVCCAPVLAGVIALSGVAAGFVASLALGLAFVFGMVAPLFAIALLWESRDWRSSRLFKHRSFTLRVGSFYRTVSGTDLASGSLLVAVGVAMTWVGLTQASMPDPSGWPARLSAALQHYGSIATDALSWIPRWAAVVGFTLVLTYLGRRALRQTGRPSQPPDSATSHTNKEELHEHEDA
jgi:cytochrome c biogenesis protein CcdA